MSVIQRRGEPALQLHHRREVLHAEEVARVVHPGHEVEGLAGSVSSRLPARSTPALLTSEVDPAEGLSRTPGRALQGGGARHVGGREHARRSSAVPLLFSSSASALPAFSLRSAMTTFAPSRKRPSAIPLPNPWAAPVTTAILACTLPCRALAACHGPPVVLHLPGVDERDVLGTEEARAAEAVREEAHLHQVLEHVEGRVGRPLGVFHADHPDARRRG